MNAVETLIRTALADLAPRLKIARLNVETAAVTYDEARLEVEALEAQADAYRAALPPEPEDTTNE